MAGGRSSAKAVPFLTAVRHPAADPAGNKIQVNTAYFSRPDVVKGVFGLRTWPGPVRAGPLFLNAAGLLRAREDAIRGDLENGRRRQRLSDLGTQSCFRCRSSKPLSSPKAFGYSLGRKFANLFEIIANYEPAKTWLSTRKGSALLTGLQTAEGSGPRAVELTARISLLT